MPSVTDSIPRLRGDVDPVDLVGALRDAGVCIVEGRLTASQLTDVRAAIDPLIATSANGHDDFEGFETCRLGAMLSHTEAVHPIATDELIVEAARQFLEPWCHRIQLMLTQVIAIGPGETAQRLHRDRNAWGGFLPADMEPQFNTMWALTDFTRSNGATRIVPGSHRWDTDRRATEDEILQAEMPAGSVMIFTGSVLHGGGANESHDRRIGMLVDYCLDWLRQEENQYLSCPPEIAAGFSAELAALVGYTGGGYALGYWSDPHDPRDRSTQQAETAAKNPVKGSGGFITEVSPNS